MIKERTKEVEILKKRVEILKGEKAVLGTKLKFGRKSSWTEIFQTDIKFWNRDEHRRYCRHARFRTSCRTVHHGVTRIQHEIGSDARFRQRLCGKFVLDHHP